MDFITIGYFFLGFVGIFAHFLKKKFKKQSFASVKRYFAKNFVYTAGVICGYILLFAGLVATATLGSVPVIMAGWAADSAFQKEGDKV